MTEIIAKIVTFISSPVGALAAIIVTIIVAHILSHIRAFAERAISTTNRLIGALEVILVLVLAVCLLHNMVHGSIKEAPDHTESFWKLVYLFVGSTIFSVIVAVVVRFKEERLSRYK